MRLKYAALLAVIVLAGGAILTLRQTHHPSAKPHNDLALLSASTPARQGGFTLLMARPARKGETVHFEIRDLRPRKALQLLGDLMSGQLGRRRLLYGNDTVADRDAIAVTISLPLTADFTGFTAEARGAGASYPINRWSGGSNGASPVQYAQVLVPTDYPDSVRSLDLHLLQGNKTVATWRLDNLPHPIHRIVPPVTPQTTATVAGGLFRGEARLERAKWMKDRLSICELIACLKRPAGISHWRVESITRDKEWDINGGQDSPSQIIVLSEQTKPWFSATRQVYAPGDRWLHAHYALQEYAEAEERATFTNVGLSGKTEWPTLMVAAEQTVTLPSGLTVTLPRQHMPGDPPFGQPDAGLFVRFKNVPPASNMPKSPLLRRGKNPVHVALDRLEGDLYLTSSATDMMSSNASGTADLHALYIQNPAMRTGKLPRVTLVFKERMDLRAFPFDLMLPITNPTKAHSPSGTQP